MERQGAKEAKLAKHRDYPEPSADVDAMARAVIGAAIDVHRELGPGFLESVYEESLAVELAVRQIPFGRQVSIPVFYRGQRVGESRVDLVLANNLVVELKAVEELRPVHSAQVVSYLRAGSFELGLLLNFNVAYLRQGIKRIVWTR